MPPPGEKYPFRSGGHRMLHSPFAGGFLPYRIQGPRAFRVGHALCDRDPERLTGALGPVELLTQPD